jgi:FKBP-type peptidyl-prolyl cis-trans isomerase (trigger factor)
MNEMNINKAQEEIRFSLTPEEMEPFLDKAARRLAQGRKMKGFRDGHAPRNVVESFVGIERMWEEAARDAIEDAYKKELQKGKIKPIGRPRVEILKLAPGNDFEFKAIIPVLSEFELPDYKKIAREVQEKEKKDINAEEKEINEALKWLRYSRSKEYGKEGGKGLREIKEEDLPKLNDEFAKEVGDFKTAEELTENVREGIKYEKRAKEKERLRLLTVEAILKKTKIEISPMLIEEELDKMTEELSQQLAQMDMTLEKYLENAKQSTEDLREAWRSKAQERIGASFLLQKIAETESIAPSDEEIEKEIAHYMRHFSNKKQSDEQINPDSLRSYISGIIRNEKVFQFLEETEK